MILGGLEAGGTKMVCIVGDEEGRIMERAVFATRTPEETLPELIGFFQGTGIEALGVGSFGPVQLNKSKPDYGHVTTTPKLPWRHYDILGNLSRALKVPMGFETDVNVAAVGELRKGAAAGLSSCVYFTVGTGIGAGVVADGHIIHGLVHPEFGHVPVRPNPKDPMKGSVCPYHPQGCLEGLANGPAIQERWGVPGTELPGDHVAWEIEADYLAQACVTAVLVVSPERIVMGGGVMHQPQLFGMVRRQVVEQLGGYVQHESILEHIDEYIVPPGLGDNSGSIGALLVGLDALREARA